MANDITLTSTTDSLEQVQTALGIKPSEQVTEAPAAEPEAPAPAQAGVVSATVTPPAKGAKPAAAAPAAPVAEPVAPAEATPAEPAAAEPVAEATDDDDDADDEDVDPARSAAAADLGRKGGQKRGVLQKRLHRVLEVNGQLKGQVTAAEAERNAIKAENDALRRRLEQSAAGGELAASPAKVGAPGAPASAPAADPKPIPTEYPTYDEWTEAVAQWTAKRVSAEAVDAAIKAERQRVAQQQQQQVQQVAQTEYQRQALAAQEKYDDWDEVINQPDLKTTEMMNDMLVNSEVGAEMAYYLGQDPDLCKKIFAMGDTSKAAKALGRVETLVEQRLEAEKAAAKAKKPVAVAPVVPTLGTVAAQAAPPAAVTTKVAAAAAPRQAPRPVTSAPDPIAPVGTGAVATTKTPDQMSFQEYKTWRAAGGGRR